VVSTGADLFSSDSDHGKAIKKLKYNGVECWASNLMRAVLFDLGDNLVVEGSVNGKHLQETKLKKNPYMDEVLWSLQTYRLIHRQQSLTEPFAVLAELTAVRLKQAYKLLE